MWHKSKKDKLFSNTDRDEYFKSGIIARDFECENAYEVEVCHHHSGSGKKAFGGANKWPAVNCKVSFQEGEEKKAKAFAKKLMKFIDENI